MNGNSLRRAFVALAAVAALTGGVAACGSDGGSDDKGGSSSNPFAPKEKETPQGGGESGEPGGSGRSSAALSVQALQRAQTRTEQAHSSRVSGSQELGGVETTMDGAIDWSDGLVGNLTIEQRGGDLEQLGGDGKMLARYTPDVMYVNMGPAFSAQTGGKSWISYDYDALAAVAGPSGAVLKDQIQNNTPTKSVKLLLASPDVQKVGTERIGGEETTHYSGTIDVAEFTEQSSESLTEAELEQFKKDLEANGITTERIDVWVNGDDLLVKKVETADTAQGKLTSTVHYSDYGTKVDVETPPSSDVMDFQDLMNQ
ncbi:lipoprotein [Streptomyces capparidis]